MLLIINWEVYFFNIFKKKVSFFTSYHGGVTVCIYISLLGNRCITILILWGQVNIYTEYDKCLATPLQLRQHILCFWISGLFIQFTHKLSSTFHMLICYRWWSLMLFFTVILFGFFFQFFFYCCCCLLLNSIFSQHKTISRDFLYIVFGGLDFWLLLLFLLWTTNLIFVWHGVNNFRILKLF